MAFGQRPRVSSNAYANGSNQNCGNIISDVPSTRVAAPPGGRTSVNLAWGDDFPADRTVANEAYGRNQGLAPSRQDYDQVHVPESQEYDSVSSPARRGPKDSSRMHG